MVVYVTLSMAVPQPLNTSFHGQMDPAGNEVSSAHFSTDPTTVFKPKPKPATKRVGWVYAVDLATGTVLWGTGPVARGVASVVSTDKVVLVASKAASNGTGTLMGVDKVGVGGRSGTLAPVCRVSLVAVQEAGAIPDCLCGLCAHALLRGMAWWPIPSLALWGHARRCLLAPSWASSEYTKAFFITSQLGCNQLRSAETNLEHLPHQKCTLS